MSKRQRKLKRNRGNSASRVSLQNLAGQVSETVERSIDRSSYEDSVKKGRGRSQFSQYIRGVHSNLGVTKEFELGGGIMKQSGSPIQAIQVHNRIAKLDNETKKLTRYSQKQDLSQRMLKLELKKSK